MFFLLCTVCFGATAAVNSKQCGGGHQQCSVEGYSALLQMREGSQTDLQTNHTTTPMTCALEEKIKTLLNFLIFERYEMSLPTDKGHEIPMHSRHKTLASTIRSVFHDAQDHNSLMLKSSTTGKLTGVDSAQFGEYGGVDGCLYVPFPNPNWGDWIHKRELNFPMDWITMYDDDNVALIARTAGKFAIATCENMCCTDGFLSTEEKHILCGAELSICKTKVSHPLRASFHATRFEPKSIHSMANLMKDKCVVDMHVFGSLLITEKVGGPGIDMTWGRRQADCNKLFEKSKASGDLNTHPIWLKAASYNSFDKPELVVEDFKRIGFDEEEMAALMGAHSFGKVHKYAGDFAPRERANGFCGTNESNWADGNFWDNTPDKLDNEYFKDLDSSDPNEKDVCCANKVWHGCRTTYAKWDTENQQMQFRNNGSLVPGQGCNHKWCMRSAQPWGPSNDDEANWALVSTQETLPQWNEVKYGTARRARKMMLAADWALIQDSSARKAVKKFAESENAFHEAYRKAFDRATKLGYPSNTIQTCTGERPTTTRPTVQNKGKDCWPKCGWGPGFCDDFCGAGNACCRKGFDNDPPECRWATNYDLTFNSHQCVPTLLKKGTETPSGLKNQGKKCWNKCSGAGRCDWCGSSGACCKDHDFNDPIECSHAIGHLLVSDHECVLVPAN